MDSPTITACFAARADRQPQAIAVSGHDLQLTYADLDARANQLAHRLVDLGVRPGDPVGVLTERSWTVAVAFLAVLKAGGCYLPIHEAYPPERMAEILGDAGCGVLLHDSAWQQRGTPPIGTTVLVDGAGSALLPPDVAVGPDDRAYVMYTSGSTGRPKGVVVSHRAVLSLVHDSCWDFERHRRVPLIAPHAFDVSTYEVWVPLLHGGCVVVPPPGTLGIDGLRRLITEDGITALHLTAGYFRVVAEEAPETFTGLRELMTGGDVVSPSAVRQVLRACPGLVVRALYGPTETTLFATASVIDQLPPAQTTVPIGRPMDGVRARVLDAELRPVEDGTTGELHLGGPRLAEGYLGRPELTDERFIPDPFVPGERMYRTGDLVRRGPDGLLDFVGRADDQVKIRGFRVEPAEVEAELARASGVRDAVVVPREVGEGDRVLVAYVVLDADVPGPAGLEERLRTRLPEYMVPEDFVVLDALPLTSNGKLDRTALPGLDRVVRPPSRTPRSGVERKLCELFAEVLEVSRVGIDDDFFALGGQSLSAMRLVNRLPDVLGQPVRIDDVFNRSTVAELAEHFGSRSR